jgi:CubicO group peptidase (beta-lactamase class C family)
MRVLAAFLLTLVLAPQTHTKDAAITRLDGSIITSSDVDRTVERLMKAARVPGVGIALFNHGQIAYIKAYGLRDTEGKLPLTPDSVMTAASLSKAAFATLVMQLVQEGALDLDKPVWKYFPKDLASYPEYADLAGDARYKDLTLRILLSHTSGFPNWRSFNDGKLNINFAPGSRFAYSGEGIDLAQKAVEAATGKSVTELMRQRIFEPLGMTRSSMVWEPRFESDFANGYDERGQSFGPERRTRPDAAGSMQTTLHDYATLLQAVLQDKALKSETKRLMLAPRIAIHSLHEFPSLSTETTTENDAIHLGYGLGWGLYETPFGKAFFKEGHDDGWRHYAVGFDGTGSGMLIMTNSSNGEGIYQELLETVLGDKYTPIEWEGFVPYTQVAVPEPLPVRTAIAVEPAVVAAYVGRYSMQPGEVFTISSEGGRLYVQENDNPRTEIFPETRLDFFAKTMDLQVSFDAAVNGVSPRLTLHVKGMTLPAKRLP